MRCTPITPPVYPAAASASSRAAVSGRVVHTGFSTASTSSVLISAIGLLRMSRQKASLSDSFHCATCFSLRSPEATEFSNQASANLPKVWDPACRAFSAARCSARCASGSIPLPSNAAASAASSRARAKDTFEVEPNPCSRRFPPAVYLNNQRLAPWPSTIKYRPPPSAYLPGPSVCTCRTVSRCFVVFFMHSPFVLIGVGRRGSTPHSIPQRDCARGRNAEAA